MNREDHAPEVAEGDGSDGLIPAPLPKPDPPQAYGQLSYGQQGPPEYTNTPDVSAEEKLAEAAASHRAIRHSAKYRKRKRLAWVVIAAILLALAAGLGVGLGVGLSQNSDGDNSNSGEQAEDNSPTPTASSVTTSSEIATTTAPVKSGTTGVAAFGCKQDQSRTSANGTEYITECYTQYSTGHVSVNAVNGNVTVANLGGNRIVYSLQACLSECDKYNQGTEEPSCRAVTYYANMTQPIQTWGGNCFLKNDRGTNRNNDNWVDWGHTASAYQSCLTKTCWPEMPADS